MARFGFCGPSYRSQSVNADCQASVNLYPERDESGAGNSAVTLYRSPGTQAFSALPGSSVRGMYFWNQQRWFAVSGDSLYELLAGGGTVLLKSGLPDDGLPVSWATNNSDQLILCVGGQLWLIPLSGDASKGSLTNPFTINASRIYGGPAPLQSYWRIYTNSAETIPPYPPGGFPTPYYYLPYPQYGLVEGSTTAPQFNGQNLIISSGSIWADPDNGGNLTIDLVLSGSPTNYDKASDTGTLYLWEQGAFTTPVQVASGLGPFSFVDFIDGYFVATVADTNTFRISILEDGSAWNPIDFAAVSEFPDKVLSMIVNQEIVWMFGATKSVPYYNSGNANFPFEPVPNVLIEQGIIAPWSRVKMDNSVFWIGYDDRGQGIAWRANGYTPQRISTHAIEYEWSTYSTIADAQAYSFQDQGHTFWHIRFPTANKSWRYDVATNAWHEVSHHSVGGTLYAYPTGEVAHLSMCHVQAYNKHYVGNWRDGMISRMSIDVYDDHNAIVYDPQDTTPATTEITRVRRCPHVSQEQRMLRYNQLQVYVETGVATLQKAGPCPDPDTLYVPGLFSGVYALSIADDGSFDVSVSDQDAVLYYFQDTSNPAAYYSLAVDGTLTPVAVSTATTTDQTSLGMATTPSALQTSISVVAGIVVAATPTQYVGPVGPSLSLRWSSDGGHSWSNYYAVDCGQLGEWKTRAIWRRLGYGRDRVFEVSCSDPVPWAFVDAYLLVADGISPK